MGTGISYGAAPETALDQFSFAGQSGAQRATIAKLRAQALRRKPLKRLDRNFCLFVGYFSFKKSRKCAGASGFLNELNFYEQVFNKSNKYQ